VFYPCSRLESTIPPMLTRQHKYPLPQTPRLQQRHLHERISMSVGVGVGVQVGRYDSNVVMFGGVVK
jgi:hypothetical protein